MSFRDIIEFLKFRDRDILGHVLVFNLRDCVFLGHCMSIIFL